MKHDTTEEAIMDEECNSLASMFFANLDDDAKSDGKAAASNTQLFASLRIPDHS